MTALEFKMLRLKLGLTQKDFGKLLVIKTQQVNKIENGHAKIRETIALLADFYNRT